MRRIEKEGCENKSATKRRNHFRYSGEYRSTASGYHFADKHGVSRSEMRTKWWLSGDGRTFRDLVFPASDDIPALPIPAELASALTPYPADAPPTFVGHYWLPPSHPMMPLAPNVACLDFSVAKGGPLVAYCWDGAERPLDANQFVTSE